MKDKESGKEYAENARTEAASEVVEALHNKTLEYTKRMGVFEITSLWARLAQRTNEIMEIIQKNDMTEDLIRGLMDKYDNDEDEVRLFPVEMQFLVQGAMQFNGEVARSICKKLNKSPQELDRIMKTEALVNGADAEFVRKMLEKMFDSDDDE
tara:strand:+ start:570 stop:1028 length:459 start_codon:yes stop_codon:yes gene_type:complete